MQTLVVLPGLSSPAHPKYRNVYKLLQETAPSHGFNRVEVVMFPGQKKLAKTRPTGQMSPDAAIKTTMDVMHRLEMEKNQYRLLGISFGCCIALASVRTVKTPLNHLEKIVLWGPIPYWLSWRSFARGKMDNRLGHWTAFIRNAKKFHHQTPPIEALVTEVAQPVHVCVGANDKWVPRDYLHYLAAIARDKKNAKFSVVEGCAHNVSKTADQNWLAYLDAVFS